MGDDGELIQMDRVLVAWDGKSGTVLALRTIGGRVKGMRPKPQTAQIAQCALRVLAV